MPFGIYVLNKTGFICDFVCSDICEMFVAFSMSSGQLSLCYEKSVFQNCIDSAENDSPGRAAITIHK